MCKMYNWITMLQARKQKLLNLQERSQVYNLKKMNLDLQNGNYADLGSLFNKEIK